MPNDPVIVQAYLTCMPDGFSRELWKFEVVRHHALNTKVRYFVTQSPVLVPTRIKYISQRSLRIELSQNHVLFSWCRCCLSVCFWTVRTFIVCLRPNIQK